MEHLFTTIILINALVVKRKNNNTSFLEDVKSQFAQRRKKDTDHKASASELTEARELLSRVTYSISKIVQFVNNSDILRYIEDEMLTSGQRKSKRKLIADTINNTVNGSIELFCWNKKEVITLLQGAGLQLPSRLPQDGFVHSIIDVGSKVKTKFSNVTETQ